MANPNIDWCTLCQGRQVSILVWKETTPWIAVLPTFLIPTVTASLNAEIETAEIPWASTRRDATGQEIRVSETTSIDLEGFVFHISFGMLLCAWLWVANVTQQMQATAIVWWPFVVGETVTGWTSTATGVVVFNDTFNDFLYIETTTLAFTDTETITGWTSWATATINFETLAPAYWPWNVITHVFQPLADNNCLPTLSTYYQDCVTKDATESELATFVMLNTLDLSFENNDFLKYTASLLGKAQVIDTDQAEPTLDEDFFQTCKVEVVIGDTLAEVFDPLTVFETLNTFDLSLNNNAETIKPMNSCSVEAVIAKDAQLTGSLSQFYTSASSAFRNYQNTDATKIMRVRIQNTDAANQIWNGTYWALTQFPTLEVILFNVRFVNFSRTWAQDDFLEATVDFSASYDSTNWFSSIRFLTNQFAWPYA